MKAALWWGLLLTFASGCACQRGAVRQFSPGQDTFSYANELRWTYEINESNEVKTRETEPPPEYSLHCFPMVRAAREFYYHARFDSGIERTNRAEYARRVGQVVGRNSRRPSTDDKKIVIPGFANLHQFSAAYPDLLQDECGGAWLSFFQRGNWRMVFPVTRGQEEKAAARFSEELRAGLLPIAHVYTFPNTKLNHAILIYAEKETPDSVVFQAYDPNNPSRAVELRFERATRSFLFERNQYFGGGPVRVYEVYHGLAF